MDAHEHLGDKPGAGLELEKTFREVFRPAISAQPGFSRVALLQSTPEADRYGPVIEFQSEELRLCWVATDLHRQVWPRMEVHCASFAAKNFTFVLRI
jgi:heme-degrading monooxygenase HmoA